jgi:hypothetical protein
MLDKRLFTGPPLCELHALDARRPVTTHVHHSSMELLKNFRAAWFPLPIIAPLILTCDYCNSHCHCPHYTIDTSTYEIAVRKHPVSPHCFSLLEIYCNIDHGVEVIVFIFQLKKNLSSRTMALGSTQPLIELSTTNLPRGKWWPARKADNLTAICEPIF